MNNNLTSIDVSVLQGSSDEIDRNIVQLAQLAEHPTNKTILDSDDFAELELKMLPALALSIKTNLNFASKEEVMKLARNRVHIANLQARFFGNNPIPSDSFIYTQSDKVNIAIDEYEKRGANYRSLTEVVGTKLDALFQTAPANAWNLLKLFVIVDIAEQKGIFPKDLAAAVKKGISAGKLEIKTANMKDEADIRRALNIAPNSILSVAQINAVYEHGILLIDRNDYQQDLEASFFDLTKQSVLIHELVHFGIEITGQVSQMNLPDNETIAYGVATAFDQVFLDDACKNQIACQAEGNAALEKQKVKDSQNQSLEFYELFRNNPELKAVFHRLVEKARRLHQLPMLGRSQLNNPKLHQVLSAKHSQAYAHWLTRNGLLNYIEAVEAEIKQSIQPYYASMRINWKQAEIQLLERHDKTEPLSSCANLNPRTSSDFIPFSKCNPLDPSIMGDDRRMAIFIKSLIFVTILKNERSPSEAAKYLEDEVIPKMLSQYLSQQHSD